MPAGVNQILFPKLISEIQISHKEKLDACLIHEIRTRVYIIYYNKAPE